MFDSDARYFQVNRSDLAYLKFILEAYEGLAILSTVDREGAIVRIGYPQFSSRDVGALLNALGKEIHMKEVQQPADCSGRLPALHRGKETGHAG